MGNWYDIGSTALGGIGGIFSTLINNNAQKKMAREQMQWQQQENERAYQRDIQFWNMQNQYNSPASQRQRLEEAGMNAQLAFGNGITATTGNSSGQVSYKPAEAIMPNLQPYNLGEVAYNMADRIWQRQLFEQQKKLQDAQIGDINASTLNKLQDLELKKGTFNYSIEQAKENLANTIANTNRLKQQTDIEKEAWELNRSLKRLDIDVRELDIDLKKIGKDERNFDLEYKKEVRLLRVAAEALEVLQRDANISLTKEQKNKVMQETLNLAQTHDITGYWDNLHRILGTEKPNSGTINSAVNQLFTMGLNIIDNIATILGAESKLNNY